MSTFTPINAVADAVAARKLRQAFYTPLALVDKLAEWADISEETRVLEPSAGDGRLVHALRKRAGRVDACEIDTALHARIESAGGTIVGSDFLAFDPMAPLRDCSTQYDAIVMNPPFRGRTWAKHVEHAWHMLAPGGTILSVVPAMAVQDLADCRLKLPECNRATYEELDSGLFAEYGTNVRVGVLEIVRFRDVECCGFRNGATSNAVLTIQNDRELLTAWVRDNASGKRRALREIATGGGSTYGIDWQEVTEHLAEYR